MKTAVKKQKGNENNVESTISQHITQDDVSELLSLLETAQSEF